ncbi:hypothetical protein [Plebeiibacterium sediminum]|uniref:Uncharacterized protein n=1 Tax=Plebeiibacterium sediminum TaxID=2992112 RepID=A0AAE3SFT1_9BACT|nr:hypothetical protein [Plebeiobacterium sediminum]MCW3787591.1 hypothetical protein [Plebeiobacterium sediminum]
MISKIRAGILSCVGLMIINLLRGLYMIPNLELGHLLTYNLIFQIGSLWFSISLWIVIKYDFVKLNALEEFKKPLDWLIRNIAIVYGVGIVSFFFPSREFYIIILILGFILMINYIIVFVKIYKLDKSALEFVGELHRYIISMIVFIMTFFVVNVINEFNWHMDLDFAFYILIAFPLIFLIRFLHKEKKDIESKQRIYSID